MKKIAVAFIITLFVIPAAAQIIYSNGPTNGNTDAWTVNFGFIVSDSFRISSTTLAGAEFAMWLFPGDTLTSAELSITSAPDGGTSYFDQTLRFTQSSCQANQYGFNVCNESTSFNGPFLSSGTYWINLQNASVPSGDPVYWDENSGGTHAWPPHAYQNAVGSIPAESFTLLGECICGCSDKSDCSATTSGSTTAPEPGSLSLLGWGGATIFAFLGALRRRLF